MSGRGPAREAWMARRPLGVVPRDPRRAPAPPGTNEPGDGELLGRYVATQDSAAFEALMSRHGAMVWRVCNRMAHEPQDAEDAFQATFLVLLRKAHALDRRPSLGSWLYGVAFRAALKANACAVRRRAHERQAAERLTMEQSDPDRWNELRPVLDAELSGLPEKYRAPLVLCYLEGRSNEQAARELGWAAGSMSRRLECARTLLHRRLVGRGVTLSGAALAALLAQNAAQAAVPAAVSHLTLNAAHVLLTAGPATAVGAVSSQVAGLTEGVLKAMLIV